MRTGNIDWLTGLKLSEFVALDVETTGLDPTTCEIIEIGAVRFRDGKPTDEFRTFVHTAKPLDSFITELTGIRDVDLADAPPIAETLCELEQFLGASPLAGQNIEFDIGFLRVAASNSLRQPNGLDLEKRHALDTAMLARVFWPELPSFSLSSLCRFFDIAQSRAHRAADDARATGSLLVEIVHRLPDRIWRDLATELYALIGTTKHRSRVFFSSLCDLADGISKPDTVQLRSETTSNENGFRFNQSPIDLLGKDGLFERRLPFFKARKPQLEMAAAAMEAFVENHTLIAEAPTGVGKSLAYLVPALSWVTQDLNAGRQVVVSSHTKVLQEQLLRKDVEDVSLAAEQPLQAAVLKGRNNYLCKRRLRLLLKEADDRLSDIERIQLMPLLRWSELTQTGDISTINGFSPRHQPFLWSQVSSDGLACSGSACSAAKGDFHRLAQERAAKAHVIFVNHALLLSDLSRFCGPHRRLIMDEAHQIERAVVAAMTTEISLPVLRGSLSRLADERSARGLLLTLESRADVDTLDLQTLVRTLHADTRQAFASLGEKLAGMLTSGERSSRLRFRASDRLHAVICTALSELLAEWTMCATRLLELIRNLADRKGDDKIPSDLFAEVRSITDGFSTLGANLERHLGDDNENEVRWLEFGQSSHGRWSALYSAPISVGKVMRQSFWPQVENAVLTSATLSISGDLSLTKESLGLDEKSPSELRVLLLDGPINFAEQMRLFVPTYLPEPRVHDSSHIEGVITLCREMVEQFNRGTLILCTSNEQVERLTAALKPEVKRKERLLLSQTNGHSLPDLLTEFRRRKDAILIGAASLWEGIDVVGEALQILIVTRLPFDVPTDPWISARCEALQNDGHDPFLEYNVPTVTLRLRQGLGRLIRHPDDRGVAVITDPRLFLSRYGRTIRNALPVAPQAAQNLDELLVSMRTFWEG